MTRSVLYVILYRKTVLRVEMISALRAFRTKCRYAPQGCSHGTLLHSIRFILHVLYESYSITLALIQSGHFHAFFLRLNVTLG